MDRTEEKTKFPKLRKGSGIFFSIVSAVSFGTSPFFAKNLYLSGMDVDSVLFFRFLPAVILLGGIVFFRRNKRRLSLKELAACLIAGLLFCITSLLLFMSYQDMDIGIAATLLFLYPVFVVLISAVLFKERLTRKTLFALVSAFAGVALLSISAEVAKLSFSGLLLAVLSAVSYAVYQVWIAHSAAKKVPSVTLTFYIVLTCLLFYVVRLISGDGIHGELTLSMVGNVAGVSMIGALLAIGTSAIALQRCGAVVNSVLGALEPFTAGVLGILVFHEVLTLQKTCGIALVIAAALCIVVQNAKKKTS